MQNSQVRAITLDRHDFFAGSGDEAAIAREKRESMNCATEVLLHQMAESKTKE